MYSIELKVKRKQLASEARDIRAEERKAKASYGGQSSQYLSLHGHRTGVVRNEARYSHLAHAFLTGRDYKSVERSCGRKGKPYAGAIARLVNKFGGTEAARLRHLEQPRDPLITFFRGCGSGDEQSKRCLSAVIAWLDGGSVASVVDGIVSAQVNAA